MQRNQLAAIVLLLAMTCSSGTSIAAGDNLVPNGNFDTDLRKWQNYAPGSIGWSSDDADSASDSGSAEIIASFAPSFDAYWLGSRCIPVIGGHDYVLGAATKLSVDAGVSAGVSVTLSWHRGSRCQIYVGQASISVPRGGWTKSERTVSAPANATFAAISLSILKTGGAAGLKVTAQFDDVVLTAVAPASSTTTTLACQGACGDPVTDAAKHAAGAPTGMLVTSSDALYILQAAIGEQACTPCICDVNDSGDVTSLDALITLAASTGAPVALTCPR